MFCMYVLREFRVFLVCVHVFACGLCVCFVCTFVLLYVLTVCLVREFVFVFCV